jgi:hypothetical protein
VRDSKSLDPKISSIFEDIDAHNARVLEEFRHKNAADVLRDSKTFYNVFLSLIESLDEAFIFSNLPFEGLEELTVQNIISANSHLHYQEHSQDIQKWIALLEK